MICVCKDSLGAVYEQAAPDLERIVTAFCRRHGGDFEETLGEARLLFVQLFYAYDPGRGPWDRWWTIQVHHRLLDRRRGEVGWRRRRVRFEPLVPERTACDSDFNRFLVELPADALTLAHLILDPPPGCRAEILDRTTRQNPEHVRGAITRYLTDLGWGTGRIGRAFGDLREALR